MAKEKKKEKERTKGAVGTRGRVFKGTVTKKFSKRIVIELERTVFLQKYERFYKKQIKIHARLPDEMVDSIHIGDHVMVRECRPLSKIIHFIVVKKIEGEEK